MKKLVSIAFAMSLLFVAMAQTTTQSEDKSHTYLSYHLGFNNWGNTPISGLTGISTSGYDIRTSLSSHQLDFGYIFALGDVVRPSIGIGYESDLYKYDKTVVIAHTPGALNYQGTAADTKSKICARYVNVPLSLGFLLNKENKVFLSFSAIPGLYLNTKHTGLKVKDPSGKTVESLGDEMNPYKLDVRMDVTFHGVGFFLQVATMPLMNSNFQQELYPIKFGFVI